MTNLSSLIGKVIIIMHIASNIILLPVKSHLFGDKINWRNLLLISKDANIYCERERLPHYC